jgi:hypothetical protein
VSLVFVLFCFGLTLWRRYNGRLAKQRSLTEHHSKPALMQMLQIETDKVDAESEELAAQFLKGQTNMPWKEFLAIYLERRNLYHQRAAKLESIK